MSLSKHIEPWYTEFGGRVAQLRFAQRLSQADVGKPLNLTRASIANLENGKQRILAHQLPVLAKTLKCTVAQLFGEKDLPAKQENDYFPVDELTSLLMTQVGLSQDGAKRLALEVLQSHNKDTIMSKS